MENINFIINDFLKNILINLCISYCFTKITNYKEITNKAIFILFFASISVSMLHSALLNFISPILNLTISYFLITLFITCVTSKNIEDTLFANLISLGLVYIAYIFSGLLSAIFATIIKISKDNPAGILLIASVEVTFLTIFFRIKRFKNGFSFLTNNKYSYFKILGISIVAIILIIYSFLGTYRSVLNESLICGVLLLSIAFIIFIKKQITLSYKQMLKEDTIIQLENELKEEKNKNEKISQELETLAKINHKYATRISAVESYVTGCISEMNQENVSDKLIEAREIVQNLSEQYTKEISDKFKYINKLPKTNNLSIDNLIHYLQIDSNNNNIEFDMKVKFNINKLIENHIEQQKLETLLADHIKDSMIAIKCCNNKYRKIMIIFDEDDNNYEIKISDTGIEFDIETLLKLGLERITTHKEIGGSGIGFMTTFETLKECKASLIIEEYNHKTTNYTKSVIIRFNDKDEYKICSYRAKEIRNRSNDNRIIIENL